MYIFNEYWSISATQLEEMEKIYLENLIVALLATLIREKLHRSISNTME